MEKKEKMSLVYGYLVCLAAVITTLICVATLVNAIMDLSDPMHASYYSSNAPSLASFENYKMDVLSSPDKEQAYVPDDATLRGMYDAAVNDRIQGANHRSTRSLIVSSLLILLSAIMFFTHWRWLRRLSKRAAA